MQPSILPLYLGKDRDSDTYYFLANKGGAGRFIKYSAYPYWCASKDLSNFLVFVNPSDVVLQEVIAFVIGVLHIEVVPKARGRAERVIKTLVPEKSALEKVDGDGHASQRNKSTEGRELPGSGESASKSSTAAKAVSQEKASDSNGKKQLPSPTKEGTSGHQSPEQGNLCEASAGTGYNSLRRLPSDGNDAGTGSTESSSKSAATKPRARRMPVQRVLDGGGDATRSLPTPSGEQRQGYGSLDGNAGSSTGLPVDGTGSDRVKRKRRTKAEMLAAKEAEAKQT